MKAKFDSFYNYKYSSLKKVAGIEPEVEEIERGCRYSFPKLLLTLTFECTGLSCLLSISSALGPKVLILCSVLEKGVGNEGTYGKLDCSSYI